MIALARLIAAVLVLLDIVALWWRALTEPAWVRTVVRDLDAEQPR